MKVAYLGRAVTTRMLAPFDDPTWEIWGQEVPDGIPRWDRWFEVHEIDKLARPQFDHIINFLLNQDGSKPIVMGHPHPQVKGCEPFPYQRIEQRWGKDFCGRWLTSCTALAMAYAIELMVPEGAPKAKPGEHQIGLFGVEMALIDEYAYQRPGCHRMQELAASLGINVVVPDISDLMAPAKVYALDIAQNGNERKMLAYRSMLEKRSEEAGTAIQQAQQMIQQKTMEMAEYSGMLKMLDHAHKNSWFMPAPQYLEIPHAVDSSVLRIEAQPQTEGRSGEESSPAGLGHGPGRRARRNGHSYGEQDGQSHDARSLQTQSGGEIGHG